MLNWAHLFKRSDLALEVTLNGASWLNHSRSLAVRPSPHSAAFKVTRKVAVLKRDIFIALGV